MVSIVHELRLTAAFKEWRSAAGEFLTDLNKHATCGLFSGRWSKLVLETECLCPK